MPSKCRKYTILCLYLVAANYYSCLLIAEQTPSRPVRSATNEQLIGCDYSSGNPAAFAVVGRACASLSVAPSPFGFADLSFSELYAGYSIDEQTAVSAGVCGVSGTLYSRLEPRASVKYSITNEFILGIGAGLSYQRFANYESSASGYFDIGTTVSIAEGLRAGLSINNLGGDDRDERLHGLFSISYIITERIGAVVGSRTELGAIISCYSELMFRPSESIAIAVGGGTEPMLYGARFGVGFQDFSLTFRAYSTKDLGWRLSSGIGYTIAK